MLGETFQPSIAKMTSLAELNIKLPEKKIGRKMICKCPFMGRVRHLLDQEEKLDKFQENLFAAFNWLTVFAVTTLSIFTGINDTSLDAWDMSTYCDDPKFNKMLTPVTKIWAILTVILLMVTTILMMSVRMIMYNKVTKDVFNIANYLIGFLLGWDISYILKNLLSYPIPSYYSVPQLKMHYCCKENTSTTVVNLEELDMSARGSFPSFLMCSLCYVSIFFYMFASLTNNTRTFVAKLVTLIVPGVVTLGYAWLLWRNGENHVEDILAGSFIGSALAVYIMTDVLTKDNKFDRLPDDVAMLITKEFELYELKSSDLPNGEERMFSNTLNISQEHLDNIQLVVRN